MSDIDKNISEENKFFGFLKKNKKFFYFSTLILIFIIGIVYTYFQYTKKINITLSENYVLAQIEIKKENKNEAKNILINIINKKNKTYSPMSLNLIIDNKLDNDENIVIYFDKIIGIRSLDNELKNLYKFKKAVFISETKSESEILEILKPIINSKSVWRVSAINFMKTYYTQKNNLSKAAEFQKLLEKNTK